MDIKTLNDMLDELEKFEVYSNKNIGKDNGEWIEKYSSIYDQLCGYLICKDHKHEYNDINITIYYDGCESNLGICEYLREYMKLSGKTIGDIHNNSFMPRSYTSDRNNRIFFYYNYPLNTHYEISNLVLSLNIINTQPIMSYEQYVENTKYVAEIFSKTLAQQTPQIIDPISKEQLNNGSLKLNIGKILEKYNYCSDVKYNITQKDGNEIKIIRDIVGELVGLSQNSADIYGIKGTMYEIEAILMGSNNEMTHEKYQSMIGELTSLLYTNKTSIESYKHLVCRIIGWLHYWSKYEIINIW